MDYSGLITGCQHHIADLTYPPYRQQWEKRAKGNIKHALHFDPCQGVTATTQDKEAVDIFNSFITEKTKTPMSLSLQMRDALIAAIVCLSVTSRG